MVDTTEDNVTIGRRLRRIRLWRRKSQAVVAGLAGISEPYLSLLETGKRALNRRSLIVALANALEVAPSELVGLPEPAPGDETADVAVTAVRRALQAVDRGAPNGQVQPADQLTTRVHAVLDAKQRCLHAEVGMVLPDLIRDLHTSIQAGRDDAELLRLAVALHAQGTQAFLHGVGAPEDLCWSAARLARDAAERLDEPVSLGIAAFGVANGLLSWGDFAQAGEALHRVDLRPADDMPLVGMLTLSESLLGRSRGTDRRRRGRPRPGCRAGRAHRGGQRPLHVVRPDERHQLAAVGGTGSRRLRARRTAGGVVESGADRRTHEARQPLGQLWPWSVAGARPSR